MLSRVFLVAALMLSALSGAARADGPGPSAATASTVKLPDGPGSVAGLGDQAEANVFSGQVSYGVPFDLPAGPAGFGPSLGLGYSGDLGNGSVGLGWSFGAPAIRRSTREGVPRYDQRDELEITAPVAGRVIRLDDGSYRVEGAGNAFRVVRSGERWTVTASSGVRYVYGLTDASRFGERDRIAAWMLEAVFHPNGQRIDYRYGRDRGELYLESIVWGPSQAYRAQLTYEDRFDPVTSYRYGFEVVTARRLSDVSVHARGSELRRYHLEYDDQRAGDDTRFSLSRLASVRMTGFEGRGELPAVGFHYAEAAPAEVRRVAGTDGWALEERGVAFVDIDGDGMADLGRFEMGNYEYRPNLGDRFGERTPLAGVSSYDLGQVRLIDVDGDARPELVRLVDESWRTSRLGRDGWVDSGEVPGSRGVPLSGPGVALADINGDGRTDVMRSAASGTQVWLSGRNGFEPASYLPRIAASDPPVEPGAANVRLRDVNGDSLADVVWLTDSWMKVYLGRGDGRFVPWRRTFYPWGPGSFALSNLRLGDLDRDGLVDLVRITAGHILYYRGRADGSFAVIPRSVVRPDDSDADAVVALEDANGNGSIDIVWSSPRGMWLLDLAGATSRGMLETVDNGLGKTTTFTYSASAALAVSDRLAGDPWDYALPTSIPVPVTVVVDVGDGSPLRRVRYHVRDGLWDGDERRFAGFLGSRTVIAGSDPGDTAVTESRYHAGLGAFRALRGKPLVSELRDGRGVVNTVTRQAWEAHPIEDLPASEPLLRAAVLRETRTEHHEGVSEPIETLSWAVYDGQGRPVEEWNLGRLDHEGDEAVVTRRYTARDPVTWVGDLPCEETSAWADGRQLSRGRTFYGDETSTAGFCTPGKGLPRAQYVWLAEENRWVTASVVTRYSDNWNPIRTTEAGVDRWLSYDAHDERPIRESVRPEPGRYLNWTVLWDDVRGLPLRSRDPSGVVARVDYDDLGRVVGMARASRPPHVVYQYDWFGSRPSTRTYAFDGAEADLRPFTGWTEDGEWRESIAVANGGGEELLSAVRLAADRWLVSGEVERDQKGRVVTATDPYEWTGVDAREAVPPTDAPRQTVRYDAFDRIREQVLPTGAKKTLDYWAFGARASTDGLNPVTTHLDGAGRVMRTERLLDDGVVQSVDADYDPAGRLLAMHLQGGAVSHRFEYDSLGRLVYAVDPDIGERHLAYDDGGRIIRAENAEGEATTYAYDPVGRLTGVTGSDGVAYTYHYDTARDPDRFGFANGRLAWVEEPTGAVDVGYDEYGRQIRFRRSIADLDRDRDLVAEELSELAPSGQSRAIDYLDGVRIELSYDRAGRLVQVGDYWSLDAQDASGRVLRERYGNGLEQTYTRDVLGQPTRVTVGAPASPPLYDVTVGHTAWGAIDSVTDVDGRGLDHSASFTYDGAARLTRAVLGTAPQAFDFSYQYDGLQNMIGRDYTGPKQLDMFVGDYRYGEPRADGTLAGPRQLTSVQAPSGAVAAFEYDAAGRQVRHGDRTMHYNGFDQLVRVDLLENPEAPRSVSHAYGYDGFRVSTRNTDGDVQYWFSPGTSEQNGVREHLLFVGSRMVARITVGRIEDIGETGDAEMGGVYARYLGGGLMLLCLFGCILTMRRRGARFVPRRRAGAVGGFSADRPWSRAALALALLGISTTSLGCGVLFGRGEQPAWRQLSVRYYHATVSAGPNLITTEEATVFEERRFEPFGTAIDAYRDLPTGDSEIGEIDYRRDPHNVLNKKTDPDTAWSYHGARWVAPQTTQWLTPDPPVKAPDPKFMAQPWALHPYQYVDQNPVLFWDPDGRNKQLAILHTDNVPNAQVGGSRPRGDSTTAVLGIFKIGAGAAGFGAGAMLCGTVAGCVLGAPLMVASADVAGSGVSELLTNQRQPTLVGQIGGPDAQRVQEDLVGAAGMVAPLAMTARSTSPPPTCRVPIHGTGTLPGVIEVSDRVKSVAAFRNYRPKARHGTGLDGTVEFVFDPVKKRFAVGRPSSVPADLRPASPHQKLAASINAEPSVVVGGMFSRGPRGEVITSEFSGHFWKNWNDDVRKAFVDFLETRTGVSVNHHQGM